MDNPREQSLEKREERIDRFNKDRSDYKESGFNRDASQNRDYRNQSYNQDRVSVSAQQEPRREVISRSPAQRTEIQFEESIRYQDENEKDSSRNFSFINPRGETEMVQRLIVPGYLVKYLFM